MRLSRCCQGTIVGKEEMINALEAILAPMVESDEGELFLVSHKDDRLHLHLRGRFAGCPGNGLVVAHLITPLVRAIEEKLEVEVTSGAILPPGATRITVRSRE